MAPVDDGHNVYFVEIWYPPGNDHISPFEPVLLSRYFSELLVWWDMFSRSPTQTWALGCPNPLGVFCKRKNMIVFYQWHVVF